MIKNSRTSLVDSSASSCVSNVSINTLPLSFARPVNSVSVVSNVSICVEPSLSNHVTMVSSFPVLLGKVCLNSLSFCSFDLIEIVCFSLFRLLFDSYPQSNVMNLLLALIVSISSGICCSSSSVRLTYCAYK